MLTAGDPAIPKQAVCGLRCSQGHCILHPQEIEGEQSYSNSYMTLYPPASTSAG